MNPKSTLLLVAELPFSERTGGHCVMASDPGGLDSNELANLLYLARDQDEAKGDAFISVSRNAIQSSSGRSSREILILLNVETSRCSPELLNDVTAKLRDRLDEFAELQKESESEPGNTSSLVMRSNRLANWIHADRFSALPLRKAARANADVSRQSQKYVWSFLGLIAGAAGCLGLYLSGVLFSSNAEPENHVVVAVAPVPQTKPSDPITFTPSAKASVGDAISRARDLLADLRSKIEQRKQAKQELSEEGEFWSIVTQDIPAHFADSKASPVDKLHLLTEYQGVLTGIVESLRMRFGNAQRRGAEPDFNIEILKEERSKFVERL